MKLNTSQLHEGENAFTYSSEKDAWVRELITEIGEQGTLLKSPLELSLSLTKLEPDYYLKGKMGFEAEQCCSRCAENFGLKLQHPFELALVHSNNDRTAQKIVLSEDSNELDITYFEGPEIDLNPLIREQFFLSLPYQALCKPHCRGVCQSCGQNLNVAECTCSKVTGKPSPFEVLKDLKTTI